MVENILYSPSYFMEVFMILNDTIRSKISVKPKKKIFIFNIILNFCLIIVMIAGMMKILFDGFDLTTIGTMALAIVIITLYKKRPSNVEHYEFVLVDVSITDEEISLNYKQIQAYKNYDYKYTIPVSTVTVLEFSDRLYCLHICGRIEGELLDGKGKVEEFSEHFLYLEKGMERDIVASIQKLVGIPVKYTDEQ